MSPKAENVKYKSQYQLMIKFNNGEEKIFNLQPYLNYPVYYNLHNESFCAKAKVKDGIVYWDDETDIDPDRLYLESVPALHHI